MEVLLYVAKHININSNYLFITGDNFDAKSFIFLKYISELRNKTNGKVLVETYVSTPQTYMQAANLACIHGGLSTVVEAVISETPIIGFPGSQEQRENLQYVVNGGGGVIFEPTDTSKTLDDIAFDILNDAHWQKNISRLKQKLEKSGTFNIEDFLNLL